jgi:sugar phosphate isomerase/epimerase
MKAIDGFNRQGLVCKERGLKFAYHNHDYSFENRLGFVPIDLMLANTDKDSVFYEMDIYWVVIAQQDPIEWIKKHSGRFKLSHVKDLYTQQKYDELLKVEPVKDGNKPPASCVLGTGRIDFNSVLQVAKENGMEYFVVEQEKFDNSNPMADAKLDAEYMKKFKA